MGEVPALVAHQMAERVAPKRVIVCDDATVVRRVVAGTLASDPRIVVVGEAADGSEALELALAVKPDVVVLDIDMPGLGGVAVASELRARLPGVRIVALTVHDDAARVTAMIVAGADAYAVKGISPEELRRVILGDAYLDGRVVSTVFDEVVRLLRSEVDGRRALDRMTHGMVRALAAATEARDGVTGDHVDRVSRLTVALASLVAPDIAEAPELVFGALLHDIGKIGVPDAILRKPGPLTTVEMAVMRTHVEVGDRLLAPIPGFEGVRELVRAHHERWDGEGYPLGLAGASIPLAARLFSVCDAFDAMTNDRPYRAALGSEAALERMKQGASGQFDPAVVEALVGLVGAPGPCVEVRE